MEEASKESSLETSEELGTANVWISDFWTPEWQENTFLLF